MNTLSGTAGFTITERDYPVWSVLLGSGGFLAGVPLSANPTTASVGILLVFGSLGWLTRDVMQVFSQDSVSVDPDSAQFREPNSTPDDHSCSSDRATPPTVEPTVEEQLLALVDEHDGRVPQKRLVDGVDRSKGTVSRYLSRLEENGEIVKVTCGRENLIFRPDDVPDCIPRKA